MNHFSPDRIEESAALQQLASSGNEFLALFNRNQLTVEVYRPDKIDRQQPHDRDEFYLIISGKGKFHLRDQVMEFKKGDFLYVPAHDEHRFLDFSDDFVTWVFFVGDKK